MLVDRRSHSLVLRIAYDGPPGAGKATNLRQLCERLALGPRGLVEAPGGHDRSPHFFDWLDVTGGWAGSDRIRCQLAAVPGQIELARRRRHILDTADAVIFVADSRASSAPETTAALRSLARGLTDRADIPLVLQANKQDLPGAQQQQQLHDALGLAARVPVIAAHAVGGTGVLETFLLAVRLAVDHVRALLVAGELGDDDAAAARDLLDRVAADTPTAFEALDALAGAASTTAFPGGHAAPEPRATALAPVAIVREPVAAGDEPAAATDEPTRPIRVIRCQPVRTTSTAEARAMIDAAMQAAPPLHTAGRAAAPPLHGTPIASIARASQKPTAPPPADTAAESDTAADTDAETRPLRMNRFTPAKAILFPVNGPLGTDPGIVQTAPGADHAATVRAPTADPDELDSVAAIGAVLLGEADTSAEPEPPAFPFTDAGTLVAVVAVEAHTIEAITIEPIAIDAITIERPPVEPAPASRVATALLAAAPPAFLGRDDDPTWELPAVDPGSAELDSTVADAIAREDEPTAPIEMAPAVVAHGEFCVRIKPGTSSGPPAEPTPDPAAGESPRPDVPALQLPPMDLPAGMVWPGVSGRAALAAIAAPTRMADRPVPWAPVHAVELLCGEGWSAHTSAELVFDAEHGEQALADAVRWQTAVGALTPPGRTYALAPIGDRVRLWVLTPAYRTMWTTIEEAFARGDRATAARLARAGLEAVDELRARSVPIGDLDHIAVDDPPRLLATPWTPQRDRLIVQLQRLFAAAVL